MKNTVRTLVFGGQVSLTIADTTEMAREAIRRHRLQKTSATVLCKALSAMTFMSACLKEKTGEISLTLQCDGAGGGAGVSGNGDLYLRGYIENPDCGADCGERACFGDNGALTIVRDDGYNRPFVGTCALPQTGGVDEAFEEYFRISEQLPTRIRTIVEFDEKGECAFAGVAALQPLPFADGNALEKTRETDLESVLSSVREKGVEETVNARFSPDKEAYEAREAVYRCNCSREYLSRVLVTLGEEQLRRILEEDGKIKVHCHYCNTDYEFTEEDADRLFAKA